MTDSSQRLSVLGVIAMSLVLTLLVRLWWLQVVTGADLSEASTADRIRVVHEEAPRGRILDRQGDNVLVDNRESIIVTVDPRALDDVEDLDESFDREEMFGRLATELTRLGSPTTVDGIVAAIEDPQNDPLQPIPVASEVNELLEVYLLERHREFPGVDVDRESIRSYPYGSVAAHVLGYVGSINQEELDARADEADKPYRTGDEIGKAGVEATYEEHLRGTPGQRTYEIDAQGEKFVGVQQLKVIGDAERLGRFRDGLHRHRTTLEELLGSPAVHYRSRPEFLNREAELNPQPSQLQGAYTELTLLLFHSSPRLRRSPQNHPRLGWG